MSDTSGRLIFLLELLSVVVNINYIFFSNRSDTIFSTNACSTMEYFFVLVLTDGFLLILSLGNLEYVAMHKLMLELTRLTQGFFIFILIVDLSVDRNADPSVFGRSSLLASLLPRTIY